MITVSAFLLVLLVLVAPSELGQLTPAAFLRIPGDLLLAAVLVLELRSRPRRVAGLIFGVAFGLLAVVKIISIGFSAVLDRPFNLMLDRSFLEAGTVYLRQTIGGSATAGVIAAAVIAGLVIVGAVTLAFMRLSRVAVEHRGATNRAVALLAIAWALCVVSGAQIVDRVPVATHDYYDGVAQVRHGIADQKAFAAESAVDAFGYRLDDDLLAGLRGKDVIVAFVESYGRVALEDPQISQPMTAFLDHADQRLRGAGFASRSGWLTSPTTGGGSWLAQATLLSGLWIDNQQRYHDLFASDRLTLTGAFQRAQWRTVGVMPGNILDWPEGEFFDYDKIYAAADLGYRGPQYSFATIPDQYTLSAFQRLERSTRGDAPVMAAIPLISSHAPWDPVPKLMSWDAIGDGSIFEAFPGSGELPEIVLGRDNVRVRADYQHAIEYSLDSLISYVEAYGDDDLVVVVLGDHQPAPVIAGTGASRDVPITILARDPAVMGRTVSWGWEEGLRPGRLTPVWRMDTFRDRFLTAFG